MDIDIIGIKKKYGKSTVLKDITFSCSSGECVGILGCNGCGKSTLLNILSGIITSNGGEFLCDGKNLLKDRKSREKLTAYVPQFPPLIEELTAKDNLLLWYSSGEIKASASSGVIKMLGIDKYLKSPVKNMSGGMKKRLSIACAVSNRPKILFLDEPSAALDPICKKTICDYIERFKKFGGIVIIATHDLNELSVCDKCYIIKDGRLNAFDDKNDFSKLVDNL
ncbi:MAG: ABC transporter ATP-binding protein [Clostridia bacterium]|nr:ABC transporter ATP-binding protein [Clostridia bacterium]